MTVAKPTLPNPNVGLKTGRPAPPPADIGMSAELKSGRIPAMILLALAAVLFVLGALFWVFAILAARS